MQIQVRKLSTLFELKRESNFNKLNDWICIDALKTETDMFHSQMGS